MNHNQWLQANSASSPRGAPMGCGDDTLDPTVPVHIEKLDWVDGDYDRSGVYWGNGGGGTHIFAIWQDVDSERLAAYFRGKTRSQAVAYAVDAGLRPLRGNPKPKKD